MSTKSIWKYGMALILLASLLACKPQSQEEAKTEETYGAAQVKVFRVKRQKISEKLLYTGLIEARDKVVITPDVGGKIARIYVEEGDRVKKGDLVAELDTRAIRLQLEQAQAALAVAEANLNDANRNLQRMERLKDEEAVSNQQYEKIKLAYEAAEAQRQQAEAAVNLAKYNLEVSLMRAPFSGVVASKNAEVGDVINPMMGGFSSNSGVLTLMDFSQIRIEIDVSYEDIVRIRKGQKAELKVTSLPNASFVGRVAVVSMVADPSSKKFKVEVNVDNPDLILRPNTFGEVVLEVSAQEQALVIPQNALLENKYVFIADGRQALKKEIGAGLQNSEWLEVVEGLKEGDLVIVEGNYGLEDGAEIEIKEVL